MKIIKNEIKNKDGSVNKILVTSDDDYRVNIANNYQLVKFKKERKSFSDTILGSDIGVKSNGFTSVLLIALIVSVAAFTLMLLSFRI